MKKSAVRPVLITCDQIEALQGLREQERKKSGLGIAPSIHDVARKVIEIVLKKAGLKDGI